MKAVGTARIGKAKGKIYDKYIKLLIDKGCAYYCYASKDELIEQEDKSFSYNSKTRMMFKNSISLKEEESLLLKEKKQICCPPEGKGRR